MAFERARRPRRFRKKKPLRRLAKRAMHRKSAAAQGRQISTLARHLSTLKETVKADSTMPAAYWQQINAPLKAITTDNYNIIIPLTCGVSQDTAVGKTPLTNLLAVPKAADPNPPQTIGWEPIFQPRDLHPGTAQGSRASVPPWVKLYKQHCKLRFHAATVAQQTTLTVSVLRVNTKGPIANVKSVASRLDGSDAHGPAPSDDPDNEYIAKNLDYASTDGLLFNQATADPTGAAIPEFPSTSANGATSVQWNKALYHCEYQKSFTLGSNRNPFNDGDQAVTQGSTDSFYDSSQMIQDHNQSHEECSFTVNYGGCKLSSCPPNEAGDLALDPMAITDMQYSDIPPQHKRWLVIQSSNPQIGASVYAPYIQMSTMVSARVPV